jgi:hypothetical protein
VKRIVSAVLALAAAVPAAAKTHKEDYTVPCNTLWQAVRDVVRNSGKYGIIGMNDQEMQVSYNIGGNLTGKRTNTVILNPEGTNGCEMQIQTAYSGLVNNDASDFKKRVDASLAKQQGSAPASKDASTGDPPPAKPN